MKTASHQPGIVTATSEQVSPTGTAAVALLYPGTAPQAPQTATLLDHLRNQVIPPAEVNTGLHVLVGGVTPTQLDFSKALADKLPLFVAVVVVLAFVLLMLVFRSLVIPAVASVLHLESEANPATPNRQPQLTLRSIATGLLQMSGWERLQTSNPATPAHNGRAQATNGSAARKA